MQATDRQMETSYKTLTDQLGKGTAARVRLYRNGLVQGWSRASCLSRESPRAAQHQGPQTQVGSLSRPLQLARGDLSSLSLAEGTWGVGSVTYPGQWGEHPCMALGVARLPPASSGCGGGTLCLPMGYQRDIPRSICRRRCSPICSWLLGHSYMSCPLFQRFSKVNALTRACSLSWLLQPPPPWD